MHGKTIVEAWLLPLTGRLCRVPYLRAVRETFYTFMPFLVVLTLLSMAGGFLLDPSGPVLAEEGLGLGSYLSGGLQGQAYRDSGFFKALASIQGFFVLPNLLMSLLFAVALAARLAKLWHCHPLIGILCTVTGYIFIMPGFAGNFEGISAYFLGRGFFIALIVATGAVGCFSRLCRFPGLRLSVPEAVPGKLAAYLQVTVPLGLTLLFMLAAAVCWMFFAGLFGSAGEVLRAHIGMETAQNPAVAVLYEFVVRLLWWLGLNGSSLASAWSEAFYVTAQAANELEGGKYIFTVEFFDAMVVSLLGLAISIWVFSSRQDWRSISAFSMPALFFGIEEPFLFALPVVLNPMLFVPYIVAALVNVAVGWAAVSWGVVPVFAYSVPWAAPVFIDAALSTGNLMGAVLQLVWLSVDIVIYSPFVIVFNLMGEREAAEEVEGP